MLEGFFHAQDLEIYDQHRLTTCVYSNWQLKALQNARLKAPLDIYLKVNSGMNRLGFQPDRVLTVWQQLRAMANVGEMTLMSHFAEAEHPDGISGAMARIEQAAEGLECRRSLSTRRRLCGTRKRILTGFGPALFCMALRRPVSGVISPIPDYVR